MTTPWYTPMAACRDVVVRGVAAAVLTQPEEVSALNNGNRARGTRLDNLAHISEPLRRGCGVDQHRKRFVVLVEDVLCDSDTIARSDAHIAIDRDSHSDGPPCFDDRMVPRDREAAYTRVFWPEVPTRRTGNRRRHVCRLRISLNPGRYFQPEMVSVVTYLAWPTA